MSYNTSVVFLIVLYLFSLKYLDAENQDDKDDEEDVSKLKFPHQAVIFRRDRFICGGAILQKKFVLFPAHCFPTIRPGEKPGKRSISLYNVGVSQYTTSTYQKYRVSNIFIHDFYTFAKHENDLAMVRLKEAIQLDPFTSIVYLSEQEVLVEAKCLTVGFGSIHLSKDADKILNINVTVVKRENCMIESPSKFCVEAAKPFCDDEYGNYIICNNTIAGVYTLGNKLVCKKPHVYTNIFKYKDWILEQYQRAGSGLNVSYSVLVYLISIIIILNQYI